LRRAAIFIAGRDPQVEIGGGHSAYVRAHALAAQHAGFEPHLFCVGPTTGIDHADFGTVHRKFSPFRPFRALMIPAHCPILAEQVARFAEALPPPRIIHSFGVWGYVGLKAGEKLARRGLGSVPILSSYTIHQIESRSKVESLHSGHPAWERSRLRIEHAIVRSVQGFERRAYRESRLVLYNYETVGRMIRETHGAAVPCRRIAYAAEPAFRDSPNEAEREPAEIAALRPETAPLLVSVSRHDPRKGIDVLLHALARLKKQGVPFRACLVGEGRLLHVHRNLSRALGLDEQVAIPGFVPDSFAYLRRADAFCLPSRFEQSGSLSLLEALQAGAPVVASACDGIPEDVRDGEDALLVTPDDPDSLASALARVLTDRSLREKLARRALETYRRRFSADIFSSALASLYAEFGMTSWRT
jgi:glycosyltransferase involved in cell wall biosynthesis